jgi:hypothetical protein
VSCQCVGLFAECHHAQPESNLSASAAWQGSATANRPIAMLVTVVVVRVWGSATSRPYADICAVILPPRIISFANEDYPAPSYCGTPADFL